MPENNPQPHWWVLYLVLLLTIGLFVLEVQLQVSMLWHRAAESGIVLLAFVFVWVWLNANTVAFLQGDDRVPEYHRRLVMRSAATRPDRFESFGVDRAPASPSFDCKPAPVPFRRSLRLLQTLRSFIF
jgi:hypothetical protein